MSGKIVRRLDWTMAWNIDRHELWLEGLSAQGLHLLKANAFGAHRFIEGEAKAVRYRLDFSWGKLPDDYVQLISEAGWERVDSSVGWHYWRTEDAAAPEIFTDGPSRAVKFHRLRIVTGAFAAWEAAHLGLALHSGSWGGFPLTLRLGILAFCAYAFVRLTQQIRAMEREPASGVIA